MPGMPVAASVGPGTLHSSADPSLHCRGAIVVLLLTQVAVGQVPGSEAVQEGYTWRKVLASYVHLHFGGAPELAGQFVHTCQQV